MTKIVCKHYYVTGKVQGVWFRVSTQKEAERIGVNGWVRNLPDGRVEVMASGEESHVQELERWLHQGPEKARVDQLEVEVLQVENFTGFQVR